MLPYEVGFFLFLEIEHCDPSPCLHGGTCKGKDGKFNCSCSQDWTGSICESEQKGCPHYIRFQTQ